PVLISEDTVITQPAKILNFLRKQKYNADYELSAKQGADTLAYIALLEEKLLPAVLHTFWVEAENYCTVTKPWFASRIPFPLSLYLPGKMSREALNRILLMRGEPPLYSLSEVEAQIYRDAKECLNLLSNRLGTSQFFFGNMPTTLDAFVFGFLAPLYKVRFPRVQLQEHLKQLSNLCRFCDDILSGYFRLNVTAWRGLIASSQVTMADYHSKSSPAWSTAELLDLISIWGEKAVQSQLLLSHMNWDTYGHISRGLCEKCCDRDMLQCRAKIKVLRQVYHKVREANYRSGASPKTCQFYKELDAILCDDPTSIPKSPMDASEGMEAAEGVPNPEDQIIDEEVELEEGVQLPAGSPSGAGSHELFSTPEGSSQSQQLLSGEQEAGGETPGVELSVLRLQLCGASVDTLVDYSAAIGLREVSHNASSRLSGHRFELYCPSLK
ncbi:Metaxin-3, partial [Chelonia mydas]